MTQQRAPQAEVPLYGVAGLFFEQPYGQIRLKRRFGLPVSADAAPAPSESSPVLSTNSSGRTRKTLDDGVHAPLWTQKSLASPPANSDWVGSLREKQSRSQVQPVKRAPSATKSGSDVAPLGTAAWCGNIFDLFLERTDGGYVRVKRRFGVSHLPQSQDPK